MSDQEKPGLQVRLEKLGWQFNEKAAMGAQWTKTDPSTNVVYDQRTEEWLYDYTAAQADQEMARGRALIEARQELLEKRQQREGAGPQTPSQ